MRSDPTLETIDGLLAAALEETVDSEAHYKIRSARQLLAVVQERLEELDRDIDLELEELEELDELDELPTNGIEPSE